MATPFQSHNFRVGDDIFLGKYFPGSDTVSVFRDGQFIASYFFDRDARPSYWLSINTGISLTLLSRLEPAMAALPREQ